MKVDEAALGDFFGRLGQSRHRALLLDYDGTLAPFRVERDLARPYSGVRRLLARIRDDATSRLVIISGRAAGDVAPLLDLAPPVEIWGSHGWERLLPDGSLQVAALAPEAAAGLAKAFEAMKPLGLAEHCERKPASLAVHWRGCEEGEAARIDAASRAAWEGLASGNCLEVKAFDGGVELRASGRTKADAVREILAEMPPDTVVAYLGDDLTDEDAFRALGSRGLGVLVRAEPRPTAAGVWLRPPEELLAFLERWAGEGGQHG